MKQLKYLIREGDYGLNGIPHIIHYCWFGGNPLPDMAIKCIDSWKKYCPDFEIKQWDESNYDVNKCDYIKEAYEAKKWAFVSDYARYDILYNHGGLYFDTDVELIKPIDDILKKGAFMGIECQELYTVNPGLGLAAPKGIQFYKDILDFYDGAHFVDGHGNYNLTTIVTYTTDLLRVKGMKLTKNVQCIEGITIYPKDYFCPMDYETGIINITNNTCSIHHFHQSWIDDIDKYVHKIYQKSKAMFGVRVGLKIGNVISLPYRVASKLKKLGLKKTIIFVKERFCANAQK